MGRSRGLGGKEHTTSKLPMYVWSLTLQGAVVDEVLFCDALLILDHISTPKPGVPICM